MVLNHVRPSIKCQKSINLGGKMVPELNSNHLNLEEKRKKDIFVDGNFDCFGTVLSMDAYVSNQSDQWI